MIEGTLLGHLEDLIPQDFTGILLVPLIKN
jgi:hypothetical protein